MTPSAPSASKPRRTQAERRSEAESKLMIAAMELIAEHGAERTSLAQIGKRAGFSRGIVNHHFGTKAALIERIVLEAQAEFSARLLGIEHETGLDELLAAVDLYLRSIVRPSPHSQAFLVLWAEAAGAGRELRPVLLEGDRRFRAGVKLLIEKGIEDGSVRATANPIALAAMVVGQLRGIALESIIDQSAFRIDAVREELVLTLRTALAPGR